MDVFKDSDPLGGNWKKQEIVTAKLSKMFKFDEIEGLIFQFRLFLKCKYLGSFYFKTFSYSLSDPK